jgi:hypothetical protein
MVGKKGTKIFHGLTLSDELRMCTPLCATDGLNIYHDGSRIVRVTFDSKCVCNLDCKYPFIHEATWTNFCKCKYSKRGRD